MMIGTKVSASSIKRNWHLFDAKEEVLGRLASKTAQILMGKHKAYWVPHLDCGDFVVILNAKDVKVTGSKEENKIYYRHSGYPGALKQRTLAEMRTLKPEEVIRHAVVGMLPKSRLGRAMVKKLFIIKDSQNPYKSKFKGESGLN